MRRNLRGLLTLLVFAACQAGATPPAAPTALQTVAQLGRTNGQALACGEKETSDRAKQLMLDFAPRTTEYGATFEQATHQGFLEQVRGKAACPATGLLALRVEVLARTLRGQPATGD